MSTVLLLCVFTFSVSVLSLNPTGDLTCDGSKWTGTSCAWDFNGCQIKSDEESGGCFTWIGDNYQDSLSWENYTVEMILTPSPGLTNANGGLAYHIQLAGTGGNSGTFYSAMIQPTVTPVRAILAQWVNDDYSPIGSWETGLTHVDGDSYHLKVEVDNTATTKFWVNDIFIASWTDTTEPIMRYGSVGARYYVFPQTITNFCVNGCDTINPSSSPTNPSSSPTKNPSHSPTDSTYSPTISPTVPPTESTYSPTISPTVPPTESTYSPTISPTESTNSPTESTYSPTISPTESTYSPTISPTENTNSPTESTYSPTISTTLTEAYGDGGTLNKFALNQGRIYGFKWGYQASGPNINRLQFKKFWSTNQSNFDIFGTATHTPCTPFNISSEDYITGYTIYVPASNPRPTGLIFTTRNNQNYSCLSPDVINKNSTPYSASFYIDYYNFWYLSGFGAQSGNVIHAIQFQFTKDNIIDPTYSPTLPPTTHSPTDTTYSPTTYSPTESTYSPTNSPTESTYSPTIDDTDGNESNKIECNLFSICLWLLLFIYGN